MESIVLLVCFIMIAGLGFLFTDKMEQILRSTQTDSKKEYVSNVSKDTVFGVNFHYFRP